MELFLFLALLVFVPGICFGAYKLFLLLVFPDAYRDTLRYDHERDMARRAQNQQTLGLFGAILKLFR